MSPRFWPVTPAKVMEHLKARGADIDLPTACHTGDIARVRELLRQDPSLANKLGDHEGCYLGAGAPLSNAAAVGRMDIVQLLLDHGADPNLREEQYAPKGKALYSAVFHGHFEIAKLLLERGAFPNPPVESSGDALWVSREWRPDKRMEQLLLSYGANRSRNARPRTGPRRYNWLRISPLHHAAREGDLKKAKQLLNAGADLTARDEHLRRRRWRGRRSSVSSRWSSSCSSVARRRRLPDDPAWATPRAWAMRRGHEKIAELL